MPLAGKRIGERIQLLREWQGISQVQLAERAGCTAAAISQYENGVRVPSLKHFRALCKALRMPYEVLLEDADLSPSTITAAVLEPSADEAPWDTMQDEYLKNHINCVHKLMHCPECPSFIICKQQWNELTDKKPVKNYVKLMTEHWSTTADRQFKQSENCAVLRPECPDCQNFKACVDKWLNTPTAEEATHVTE